MGGSVRGLRRDQKEAVTRTASNRIDLILGWNKVVVTHSRPQFRPGIESNSNRANYILFQQNCYFLSGCDQGERFNPQLAVLQRPH